MKTKGIPTKLLLIGVISKMYGIGIGGCNNGLVFFVAGAWHRLCLENGTNRIQGRTT